MKQNILLLIIMCTGIFFVPTHSTADPNTTMTVNIAMLSPVTGALSAYSQGFVNGAKLAVKQIMANASFSNLAVNFTVYDTQTTPLGATYAMTNAAGNGSTFVVGAAGSSDTLAAAAIAIGYKIPVISYASSSPDLTSFNDSGYLFRVVPSDAFQGAAMADIANSIGYKTAVIVHLDNAYGTGIAKAFTDAYNGTIRASISYDPNSYDAAMIVAQINGQNPGVVIDASYASDGAYIFTQMATQDVKIPIIGADGIADNAILNITTGTSAAMQGVVATKPTKISSPSVTKFQNDYKTEYGVAAPIYSAQAYDSVYAGVLAIEKAGTTNGTAIAAALPNVSFNGGSGTIKFDMNGDITSAAYNILEMQSTGYVQVGDWINGRLNYSPMSSSNSTTPTSNTVTSTASSNNSTVNISESASSSSLSLPFPFFSLIFAMFAVLLICRRKLHFRQE